MSIRSKIEIRHDNVRGTKLDHQRYEIPSFFHCVIIKIDHNFFGLNTRLELINSITILEKYRVLSQNSLTLIEVAHIFYKHCELDLFTF